MGRRLKKIIKVIVSLFLLIVLFRGWIFRNTVNYTSIGERSTYTLKDKKLIAEIEKRKNGQHLPIEKIITIAESLTIQKLQFTSAKVTNDPNQIIKIGKANCIGYAALFNAIGNHIVIAQKDESKYKFRHLVGKIDFMGIDLHHFFSGSFFKSHDYNEIELLESTTNIYIDSSVSDYLAIHRISSKK